MFFADHLLNQMPSGNAHMMQGLQPKKVTKAF
jgi:hypothetical protein